jgi:hypothetical protein
LKLHYVGMAGSLLGSWAGRVGRGFLGVAAVGVQGGVQARSRLLARGTTRASFLARYGRRQARRRRAAGRRGLGERSAAGRFGWHEGRRGVARCGWLGRRAGGVGSRGSRPVGLGAVRPWEKLGRRDGVLAARLVGYRRRAGGGAGVAGVGLGLELLEHRRPVEEAGRREEKGGGRVGPAREGGRGIFSPGGGCAGTGERQV